MTVEQLREEVERHADESVEDLADDLYVTVKAALSRGQRREDVYAILTALYADFKARDLRKYRKAVGEVIRCFDGYCAPSAAL